MNQHLPGIVVTGASGFIGRHFIESARGKYRLFCLARRSQKEAGIPVDKNIRWTQVDIAEWDNLREVVRCIKTHGSADFVLHLAGYYNFNYNPHPEYKRTNVDGTQHILKLGKLIGIKRFIFASSLAACNFPPAGQSVTEETSPDASFPYAWSKRLGEEMMANHTSWFPITTLRLAAIYSDWCEYPPLYMFLKTWLSNNWNNRILGGKGDSAVTYLHIQDLIKLIFLIIEKSDSLPRKCTYNASPSGSTSHIELYKTATRYYYGRDVRPIRAPKSLATVGMLFRQWLGDLFRKPPFERFWMAKYIDKKLTVDAAQTFNKLGWKPTPRHDILRRLLFLIENMKTYPEAWDYKNKLALNRIGQRPNLIIYDSLAGSRQEMIDEIFNYLCGPENSERFPRYQKMPEDTLRWYLTFIYQLLMTAVRTRDRLVFKNYARMIAQRRYTEGFSNNEVLDAMRSMGELISAKLLLIPQLKDVHERIYDLVSLTFQMVTDEIEGYQERISAEPPEFMQELPNLLPSDTRDLERIVHEFEDICQDISEKRFCPKSE